VNGGTNYSKRKRETKERIEKKKKGLIKFWRAVSNGGITGVYALRQLVRGSSEP